MVYVCLGYQVVLSSQKSLQCKLDINFSMPGMSSLHWQSYNGLMQAGLIHLGADWDNFIEIIAG